MYANLAVTVKGPGFEDQGPVSAWDIDITPDAVVIHLDDPDGEEESYANPAGTVTVPREGHTISIRADF